MITVYWKQAGMVLVGMNVITMMLLYQCCGGRGTSSWKEVISGSAGTGGVAKKMVDISVNWDAIPERSKPDAASMNDKWIVLTSIFAPTEDVKKLADVPGWKLVVVGDTKTPKEWSHPNVVFLSVEKQVELDYKIIPHTPFKSYTRKNVGYLYAIEHGAKVIYETDDDNSPTSGKIEFDPSLAESYFSYTDANSLVNPYSYFGQSSIWPRGYPLNKIAEPDVIKFKKCKDVHAYIQQGVVNGDPDIDAIYRLTRKDVGVQLDLSFDLNSKPLVLPKNVMAPFNSQNTLFLNSAFFMLMLPQSVTFRVTDIWRGYWGQRLLWDVNGQLSFFAPNAYQKRTAHDYLLDFIEEKDLYYKTGDLIAFLLNWKSDRVHLFDRVLELFSAMAEKEFIGVDDVELAKAWLMDLKSIGYKPPPMKEFQANCDPDVIERQPSEQPSSYLRMGKKLVDVLAQR